MAQAPVGGCESMEGGAVPLKPFNGGKSHGL